MSKILLSLIFTFLPIFSQAASTTKQYRINVGNFDKVVVSDNVNVVYLNKEDSVGYINYSCSADLADAVIASCNKGKLKIQIATEAVNAKNLPTLYIYSDFLYAIENSSDSTFTVKSIAPCSKLSVKQLGNGTINVENIKATNVCASLSMGAGHINITGACSNAELRMIGTGVIQSDLLKANTVECKILGTGSIGCDPKNLLIVKGIGSTKIYYKGNPFIKKSGGGKLIPLSGKADE